MANKMRLIYADALETRMGNLCDEFGTDHLFIDAIIYEIETAPTVDAVEVVRCKDCKHWHEETGWCNQHSHFIGEKGEACHPWESNDWKMLNEDDFCSYGERKDNERV